jgi:hypothetical protein
MSKTYKELKHSISMETNNKEDFKQEVDLILENFEQEMNLLIDDYKKIEKINSSI